MILYTSGGTRGSARVPGWISSANLPIIPVEKAPPPLFSALLRGGMSDLPLVHQLATLLTEP